MKKYNTVLRNKQRLRNSDIKMALNFLETVCTEVKSKGSEVKELCFRSWPHHLLDRGVALFNPRCLSFLSIRMGIIIDLSGVGNR